MKDNTPEVALRTVKTKSLSDMAYTVNATLPKKYSTVRSTGGGGLLLTIFTAQAAAINKRPINPIH
jgi:hypothetical protein